MQMQVCKYYPWMVHAAIKKVLFSDNEHQMSMNFEELKTKIKAMPRFRPFHYATNLGGSLDDQDSKKVAKNQNDPGSSSWGKQMSLHGQYLLVFS